MVTAAEYADLNTVQSLITDAGGSIPVVDLPDNITTVNQFLGDFDNDGFVTETDLSICYCWLLLGKPTSIDDYNENRGIYPHAITLPGMSTIEIDQILFSTERVEPENPEYDEISADWNGDGIVDIHDADILAQFINLRTILGRDPTLNEFNTFVGSGPLTANRLPDLPSARYSTCCDDKYTESGDMLSDDQAAVHFFYTTYFQPTGNSSVQQYNNNAEINGFPRASKLPATDCNDMCGDFDNDGEVTVVDSVIYHGFTQALDANICDNVPVDDTDGVDEVATCYNAQFDEDGYRFHDGMVHSPRCETPIWGLTVPVGDEPISSCVGSNEVCELISTTDYLIFVRWLELDKPRDLNLYNSNRATAPCAIDLPYEAYDWIGTDTIDVSSIIGLENL